MKLRGYVVTLFKVYLYGMSRHRDVQKYYFLKMHCKYVKYIYFQSGKYIYLLTKYFFRSSFSSEFLAPQTLSNVYSVYAVTKEEYPWLWKNFSKCISNQLCFCLIPLIWGICIKVFYCEFFFPSDRIYGTYLLSLKIKPCIYFPRKYQIVFLNMTGNKLVKLNSKC